MASIANGSTSHANGSFTDALDWNDLPGALEERNALTKLRDLFRNDGQFIAFITSDAITRPVTFGIKSAAGDNTILVTCSNGAASATAGRNKDALFTLSALPYQWREFFKPVPSMPYQSYWGMFGSEFVPSHDNLVIDNIL